MPHTAIRQIEGDDILEAMYLLPLYSFRASPPLQDRAERDEQVKQRKGVTYVAAYEDSAVAGIAAASTLTQNVRGALLPMAGVHNVATHPADRRKGHGKAMLAHLLAAMHANGSVLSCLYPFRESFYERIGYVTLPLVHKVAINPQSLQPALKLHLNGKVDLGLLGDNYAAYRDFLFTLRPTIHGMAVFDHADLAGAKRSNLWLARAMINGETSGVMLYDLQGERIADFTMRIRRFYYLNSETKYLLLNWIARHIDQASKVEMWLPPYEYPETWLDDLKVTAQPIDISPMGRVLDVSKIGGMHCGEGRFTARISDTLCPWNAGNWQFASMGGLLQVSPAGDAACDLGIQAIGALVYGTQDPADFAWRGWGNPSPQMQATMRTMFPPMIPHVYETF